VTEAEPLALVLVVSGKPAGLPLGVAREALVGDLLHRDLLGLRAGADVVVLGLTLEVAPDTGSSILLHTTDPEPILAAVVVEKGSGASRRDELLEGLRVSGVLDFLGLGSGLLGSSLLARCRHLGNQPLRRHVADVLGEAAVHKLDDLAIGRIIQVVLGDERVDLDLHGSHC